MRFPSYIVFLSKMQDRFTANNFMIYTRIRRRIERKKKQNNRKLLCVREMAQWFIEHAILAEIHGSNPAHIC